MRYLVTAYVFIAAALSGYGISIWRRSRAIDRETRVLEREA